MKDECEFCGFETELVQMEPDRFSERTEPFNVCELCYSTLAGTALKYPGQYENVHIMKQISYIGNRIIEVMKSMGKEKKNE